MTPFRSIEWTGDALRLLDQRQLPHQTLYAEFTTASAVATAIHDMVVRGAPAIGVAAAFGLVLAAQQSQATSVEALRADLQTAANQLKQARPTAVNLTWALKRMLQQADAVLTPSADDLRRVLAQAAQALYQEDVEINRQIGLQAQSLIPDRATIIHHCNTGALATVDYGTALGAIRIAHEQGKRLQVYLDETRPRLQGASLSAYELKAYGVPHTVMVDSASGYLMQTQTVDLCIVGCDRVAANGDVANKIGTYNLAIAAKAHQVPFYVACPLSSIDMTLASGDQIEIEQRSAEEVTHIGDRAITPAATAVFNPAFDITPAAYISALITEKGVILPPFEPQLRQLGV
ncbi:S-methyl-5-thioribose-1-phosphate isomerase [Almyronema epifaneia]|uniref:Methylthioribose-1-phosphate isomerase n=1 Tax=Almyronema epifaneia S1 TaxID=2991925 RepID=A0ABW6IC63_9CYAN